MSLVPRSESNAVELPEQHNARNQQIAQIADWAQAAQAAHQVAKGLCETSFVPRAYQNKPMEATAAILAGAEVGLSPMASLRAFDSIQGTPAPKAMTLRAIVQGVGHEVRIEKSDETVAVVAARRRGETEWQRSTWTIERAKKMGLTSKDQWKNQPQAMLIARATAEVCRWVASDAIMGMPYTAEEIQDGDGGEVREAPRRVSLDDIDAADDATPVQATAEVGQRAIEEPKPVSSPPAVVVNPDPMPENRQKRMFALFNDTEFKERDERLAFISEIVGRPIGSSKEIGAAEGERVIVALEVHIAEQNQAEPVDGELQ
ncbi:hypothetical protein [Dactylosporangium salmoneum]|uniref:RecT family protein n=1 Tax=Dactylosporangium salmoneum TaxID=53361 RepID=A0ABN3G8R9_9ACTN